MSEQKLDALRKRLSEISDINSAVALLDWDQNTFMPAGGAAARGRQLATLSSIAHQRQTDAALGELLDELRAVEQEQGVDSDTAGLIRVARRAYDQATRVPEEFVAEYSAHLSASYHAWTQARPRNDFAAVQPFLEKTVSLSRQYTSFFPGYEHIADPLIDQLDEGVRVSTLRPTFAALREALVPLVEAIGARPVPPDDFLKQSYPAAAQLAFGEQLARQLGYDFGSGRLDLTPHPFATRFSINDVRITTRVNEHDLSDALFSTIHEVGHALYEQGVDPSFEATPLARGASSGIHESQSRLLENMVGRSKPFWQHHYPQLQAAFPAQLGTVPLDAFYRAINKVERSLIRTDADEVTYNLHVIIRFDLELALLEGSLAVADLAEAWRERYRHDLGVTPDDRDGVLQDVHWYALGIGGQFQGYTLGNILAAQLFAQARAELPQIDDELAQGQVATLLGWLRERLHRHGSKYAAPDLITRVTGGPLQIEPYLAYLRGKYGELYGL